MFLKFIHYRGINLPTHLLTATTIPTTTTTTAATIIYLKWNWSPQSLLFPLNTLLQIPTLCPHLDYMIAITGRGACHWSRVKVELEYKTDLTCNDNSIIIILMSGRIEHVMEYLKSGMPIVKMWLVVWRNCYGIGLSKRRNQIAFKSYMECNVHTCLDLSLFFFLSHLELFIVVI